MDDSITLKISAMSPSGHGIGIASDGIKYHVLGAFIGDILEVSPYKSSEGIHYAEILKLLSPSSDRSFVPKKAPFYNPHAPWRYLIDTKEMEYKQNIIENLFIGGKQDQEIFSPEKTTYYRNKSAFAFVEQKGRLAFASFQRGKSGGKKIPQVESLLNHEVITNLAQKFLTFFNQHKIPKDELKYLILRYSYTTQTCVAHILVSKNSRKKLSFKKSDLEKWLKQNKEMSGILVSFSFPEIRSATSEKDLFQIGNIDSKETLLGKNYSYHPSQFFQVYPAAFAEILKDIESYLKTVPEISSYELLDLFSGVGVIGIHLSQLVKKVISIEHSPLSQLYAEKNARENNLHNFEFHELDVDQALSHVREKQILIVDPPRSGLGKKLCKEIFAKSPEYFVYISCNPITQARDLAMITSYQKVFSRAYNLFPQTQHIEHLVILKRKP